MIRDVAISDAKILLQIYSYYVENTAILFEIKTPTIIEFENRINSITKDYPYIVYEKVDNVVAYAYAHRFHEREAYNKSAELSIYVNKDYKNQGIGRELYKELENRLKKMQITNLYALVAYPAYETKYLTTNSYDFHNHLGFTEVGHLHKCGCKFGEYFDMVYMEKIIIEH